MRIPALPKSKARTRGTKREISWVKSFFARMKKQKFYRIPPRQ